MKKLLFCVFALCALVASAKDNNEGIKPVGATVGEFFTNPIGYSLEDLTFSWKLSPAKPGLRQTAYQITVASSKEDLEANKTVWNSGKVVSDKSVKVKYEGAPIASRQRLYWRVKFWDENSQESEWSDISFFEAGLLSNSEWVGKWISSPAPLVEFKRVFVDRAEYVTKLPIRSDYLPPTYYRKDVALESKIKSARLYVTCKGIFQFYINGKKVGNDFWGTGWTDYNIRIQTNTYDVSDMLKSGDNAVGAAIGDGWYAGRLGFKRDGRGFYGKKPEILAQLEIELADGSKKVVATDESWKWSFGPIKFSDIYDGEVYDARAEIDGWNEAGYDDSAWKAPTALPVEKKPLLEPRRNQPIVQKDLLHAVDVKEISEGVFVFDMGQNMVGWPRLKIPASDGAEIKIRYAEMLNKDGTLYVENYRAAQSVDYLTSAKSTGTQVWEPTFTYHGYRYVEISGYKKKVRPSTDWVQGVVLYNDMPDTGSFFCSKPKVNSLQNCIRWGQRGNFFSTPTDCPQRDERLGWTGDAQVFIPTAAFNMDVSAFFTKWTLDLADTAKNGCPAHVAPSMTMGGGSPAWSDACVICPWEVYMAYGDEKILRNNYNTMVGWLDYMKRTSKDLIRPDVGYGDWLQPNGKTDKKHDASDAPKSLIGTAYFVRCADLVSRIATIIGKPEDSKKYKELADNVRAAFNKEFVSEDGTVKSDCQTAYLLALGFDVLPENLQAKAADKLVAAVKRDGNRLNTGFVGTPLLNPVLTRFGKVDVAYTLLNREEYPSWIYPINQGATTMWERWNSYSHENGFGSAGMNSFNHYAYGAIGQWMYRYVAGIWYDEEKPGYKNILFAPKLGGGMTFAAASHETPYGHALSSWKIIDGVMEWTVIVPPNATGSITFPTKNLSTIRLNGHTVDKSKYVMEDGFPSIKNMPSGTYQILLRP